MALPKNLDTLDYAHVGRPFLRWATPALPNTSSLDYADQGRPFYAQFDTQALSPALITISANTAEITVVARKFPNKRQEMVAETQLKQVSPLFGAQYAQYLP